MTNLAAGRPRIVRTILALRRIIKHYQGASETIALVPTMGALHAGHLSLVKLARRHARRVIVSIFVNPAQFAPHEDFGSYPRTFESDLAALPERDVDLIWAPTVEEMYPPGFATKLVLEGPASVGLEDRFRPHFFAGVATVVAKLLMQCQPDVALFGEKDYQQLKVVTRLAKDLDITVKILGVATKREKDGLALSSRNVYLLPNERAVAPTLYRVLRDCAHAVLDGEPLDKVLATGRSSIASAGFALDYLEARHAETLEPLRSPAERPIRLLVAARLGTTRLIDNIGV
ncbi:MAG: pantoate--beta-alanine ligase [Xanthobacteraceae bacterium]